MSFKQLKEDLNKSDENIVNDQNNPNAPALNDEISQVLEEATETILFSFYYMLGALHSFCKFYGLKPPKKDVFETYISDMRGQDLSLNDYVKDKTDTVSKFLKWYYGIK